MKKNDWILLASTLLYSYLFYKQYAGINFLIFNIAIVIMLLIRDRELLRDRTWTAVAGSAIFSSLFIFMYSSDLAITANLFSLAALSAISINRKTSFLAGILLTVCSVSSSFIFMFLDWVERKNKKLLTEYRRPIYVKLLLLIVPLLIALVFFVIYRSANPLFNDFTKDINLDWISFGWIFFTVGGLLLLYGFFYNRRIPAINNSDENTPLTLTEEYVAQNGFLNKLMRIDTENISGLILFSFLNILLLTVNSLDLKYLWLDGTLPEGIKHKEFVHNGVGMIIMSILFAILIILFYFRGNLNFYEKNKWIKVMAFAWIIQNCFMIFSTAYRNNMYIQESGLSYKKIGVCIYLLLVLIGLILTYIKVVKQKSNWYLFKTNGTICFFLLVFFCSFNWDMIITKYNIRKHTHEGKKLEKYYLLDLTFKNLPILLSLPDSVASTDDLEARDYYYELRGTYFSDFKSHLHKKLYCFLDEMNGMEWQSLCAEKNRVAAELPALFPTMKELVMHDEKITTLTPVKPLSSLEKIDISGCRLSNLNELARFPKLKNLNISRNYIGTIANFPKLKYLETLNVSENNLRDFSAFFKLTNLKELTTGVIDSDQLKKLQMNLPNTKILSDTTVTRDESNAN